MRFNNPGNLRPSGQNWLGQIGTSSDGFCIFDTMKDGLRALKHDLANQGTLHNLHTVRGIVEKFAPASENNTGAYVMDVATSLGVRADDQIDLLNPVTLMRLTHAIIRHEQGICEFTNDEILSA